jgi:copper chaperone
VKYYVSFSIRSADFQAGGWTETENGISQSERKVTMAKQTLSIPNISCGHCVMAIKNELNEMEGVKSVKGSIESKTVDIEWDAPATLEKIKSTLKEINYPPA